MRAVFLAILLTAPLGCASSGATRGGERWVPLFEGNDLSGWVPVNVAPGTFTIRDGVVSSTGVPTGVLRTRRHYENFVLELEWRHLTPTGNAGLFVHSDPVPVVGKPFTRALEIQIIMGDDPKGNWTGHGDVFPIQGATFVPDRPHPGGWMRCLPSERRARPAGEWNHYRVESRDGRVTLAVNGKVVSGGARVVPRRGYIALEAEGAPWEARAMRILELPSSNPPAAEVAASDEGFVSLYTGVDLAGWRRAPGVGEGFRPRDWVLAYEGPGLTAAETLWTERDLGDFVLIADYRPTGERGGGGIALRGSAFSLVPFEDGAARRWSRLVITVEGRRVTVERDGVLVEDRDRPELPPRGPLGLRPAGPLELANLYVKPLE